MAMDTNISALYFRGGVEFTYAVSRRAIFGHDNENEHTTLGGTTRRLIGFFDLPAELRNIISGHLTRMRDTAGDREPLVVHDFAPSIPQPHPSNLRRRADQAPTPPFFFSDNLLHPTEEPASISPIASLEEVYRYCKLNIPRDHCFQGEADYEKWWKAQLTLPPPKWRRLVKRLRITPRAPPLDSFLHLMEPCQPIPRFMTATSVWDEQELDWLRPLSRLQNLGFRKSVVLEMKIFHPHYGDGQMAAFFSWTREIIAGMPIDAREKRIAFLECRDAKGSTMVPSRRLEGANT